MQDTLLDVLAENFGSCCIDNIEQRRVKHVWFLTIHDDNATGSMCIIWIISPTWVLGLTFWIYLALRVAFTPNMVKVSSSLIMIWFLGWDPSCQTIQYRRYYPSTAGPWPQIWTPRSSHPLANIKQQQGNAYLDLIDCCIEWCENKDLIMLLYIFFSWLILCTLSHLSAIIMDLWSVFWTQRFLVFVFGLFSIFVSTLVAGLSLGSRKIDGSYIRNNNQCSDKLTSVPRLGSLQSLGLEDDVHVHWPRNSTSRQPTLNLLDPHLPEVSKPGLVEVQGEPDSVISDWVASDGRLDVLVLLLYSRLSCLNMISSHKLIW